MRAVLNTKKQDVLHIKIKDCQKKHRNVCTEGVVYDVLLVCGAVYVRQIKRAVNGDLAKHEKALEAGAEYSEISKHIKGV